MAAAGTKGSVTASFRQDCRRDRHRRRCAARRPTLHHRARHFTDDLNRPGQTYAVFVRSPHAHAKIKRIDKAAAADRALAVLTGAGWRPTDWQLICAG
jgi:CO/xanthine dehydrogenase Mo-binding subunit